MSETKAGEAQLILTTLDAIETTQEAHTTTLKDHSTILINLEARKILDLAGLERRLDELADTLTRQAPPLPRRAWWRTPALVTAGLLGGMLLMLGLLWLRAATLGTPPAAKAPAAVTAPAPRKGR